MKDSTWLRGKQQILQLVHKYHSNCCRIIQEFKLKPMKVYCLAGKQLAKSERYANIAELVTCINNSSADEKAVNEMCDEMLSFAVRALTNANASGAELEKLIKLINDKGTRVSCFHVHRTCLDICF